MDTISPKDAAKGVAKLSGFMLHRQDNMMTAIKRKSAEEKQSDVNEEVARIMHMELVISQRRRNVRTLKEKKNPSIGVKMRDAHKKGKKL